MLIMSVQDSLDCFGDPTKRNILRELKGGNLNSRELAQRLGMSPQALSYHLAKLKKADLIIENKVKNYIYYELNLSILDEIIIWFRKLKGDH